MNSNKIKGDSTGIQAGGNITINQHKLPDAIEAMVLDILKPHLHLAGNQLSNTLVPSITESIGQQIRNIIDQKLLIQLKTEMNANNINFHLNNVKTRLLDMEGNDEKMESIEENLEKVELFGEWIGNVENITDKNKSLSKIWDGWMAELSKGKSIANYKICLEKMKQLNSIDADLLLTIRSYRDPFIGHHYIDIESYACKKLITLELIRKDYSILFYPLICLALLFFEFFLLSFGVQKTYMDNVKSGSIYVSIAVTILCVIIFMVRPRHRLTWLGELIVSFANPSNKKS
jgi:hypothetical protein